MPWKRKGRVVYSRGSGRWKVKQRCKSAANAKAAIRLLHAKVIE
jgi:hypothetical protein